MTLIQHYLYPDDLRLSDVAAKHAARKARKSFSQLNSSCEVVRPVLNN